MCFKSADVSDMCGGGKKDMCYSHAAGFTSVNTTLMAMLCENEWPKLRVTTRKNCTICN